MKENKTKMEFEQYLKVNYLLKFTNEGKTKNKYETIYEVWKHRTAEDTFCIYEPQREVYCYVPWNRVLDYIDVKSMYGTVWHSLVKE